MDKKLYVILPCYNESKDIGDLLDSWQGHKKALSDYGYDLIITPVDDGSKDDTKNVIKSIITEKKYENINLLEHGTNKGLGKAIDTGLENFSSKASGDDVAVIMDADNTHDPKYIFPMLDKIKNGTADCVIASRYRKNSKTVGVPIFRSFLSTGAKIYYSIVLGVKNVRDYTCGYRAYTYSAIKSAYERYGDELITERTFSCMMELLYKLFLNGAGFDEIPFELRYDFKQGESKMRIMKTIKSSFITAFKLRLNKKNLSSPNKKI